MTTRFASMCMCLMCPGFHPSRGARPGMSSKIPREV